MRTKVDLQIAQCVHGVCALQSSNLISYMQIYFNCQHDNS